MRRRRTGFLVVLTAPVLALPLILGACTSERSGNDRTPTTGASSRSPGAKQATADDYDRNNFDRSASVDNPWFSLTPGKQLIFEGSAKEGDERVPRRVQFTVTDLTKVIDGVRTVVIWELDYAQGQLVEAELAFLAQDNSGNVWRFGEYPEVYEGGKLVEAPTWIHGLQEAKAGITMQADPQPGTPDYAQGLGPEVDWTDRGKVVKTGERNCVPVACYDNVVVIQEAAADETGGYQLKYYAPDVGNIRVGWGGNDESQEVLELVKMTKLNAEELAKVSADALKLEKNAYLVSKEVYALTSPMEHTT